MKKIIVSLEDFNTYSGNFDSEANSLKLMYLEMAQEIVEKYIGYSILPRCYTDMVFGRGNNELALSAYPVCSISRIESDGIVFDENEYAIEDSIVRVYEMGTTIPTFFRRGATVKVDYEAGYPLEHVPAVFRITVLRIASLLLTESDGNIGLTSKSYGDSSRSFMSYTNYSKYLSVLDPYRIVRF